jgi:hypothetical protein
MKVAVISYHSNVYKLYPLKWLEEYRDSILNQTFQDFTIYEINYGPTVGMIFWKSNYQSREFPTFVHCMNWMLDWLFNECGYDVVANTNCDDRYHPKWLEKSLEKINEGYDLVSCNFQLFNEEGIYHSHHFSRLNIEHELERNNNVICHPGVLYSKRFWQNGNRYIPEEIPVEDMNLWKRAIKNSNFIILPEHLVLHRVHDNAVCRSNNR